MNEKKSDLSSGRALFSELLQIRPFPSSRSFSDFDRPRADEILAMAPAVYIRSGLHAELRAPGVGQLLQKLLEKYYFNFSL